MPLGLQTVVLSSRPVVVIRCFRVSGDHLIALPRISHKLPGRKKAGGHPVGKDDESLSFGPRPATHLQPRFALPAAPE